MEDQKLERQVRQDKTIGDALGDLLDSMHRIGEALHQQDPKVEMRGVW